jgi:hypothetical protein
LTHQENFMSKIVVCKRTGCWRWTGARTSLGYGAFCVGRKQWGAHRYSARFLNGSDLRGKQVNHLCAKKDCVNPEHVYVGTHRQNMDDGKARREFSYGLDNPKARHSHEVVRWAIDQCRSGRTQRGVAAELGVSRGSIAGWVGKKVRAHA